MKTLDQNHANFEQLRFFNCLSTKDQTFFRTNAEIIELKKNEFIFEMGNKADDLYWIVSGRVRLFILLDDGAKIYKDLRCEGQIFGEAVIFGKEWRETFAQTIDKEVVILKLNVKHLSVMNLESLKVDLLYDRLEKSQDKVNTLLTKDALTRVKEFLYKVALERGRKVGAEYYIPNVLCHYDIAGYMHISRQTVSHFLNQLQREGIISMDRNNILVKDIAQLN